MELIGGEEGGGGSGNDEHTMNANKAMYCTALPIDLACAQERKPSPECIRLLTNHMPPLHFVCTYASQFWCRQTMVTMEYLISIFPDDPKLFYQGMLPFHCACRAGARWPLMKWWWKKFPDIVQEITTYTGDTSLHCYALSTFAAPNAPDSDKQRQQRYLAMQFLVERHPDAVRKMNRKGMLPFHVAAVHQAPLDVLFYLACQNTEALLHCSSNFVVSDCVQMIPQVQAGRKQRFTEV